MNYSLVKYRDSEVNDHIYFWTELQGETWVHVSPMFETEEDARTWLDEMSLEVKHIWENLV